MRSGRTVSILVAAVVSLLILMPLLSDNAEGASVGTFDGVDVSLSPGSEGDLDIHAGETVTIQVHLINTNANVRHVEYEGFDFGGRGHVTVPENNIKLDPGEYHTFLIEITADSYSGSVRNVTVTVSFTVYDPAFASSPVSFSITKTAHISSGRSSENQFNNVMGILKNPFPAPFDTAVYAAAATLIIWLAIALLATYVLVPKVIVPFLLKGKNKKDSVVNKLRRPVFFLLMVYGITVSVAVMGPSEYIIRTVEMAAAIIYIIFGADIAWKLFVMLTEAWAKHTVDDNPEEASHRESLVPLFFMLGKIVLGMVIAGMVLGIFGFDLMIIATGAGVIGLAISFGAQSTLAQFFSGFTLLISRPFKPGDLVRLDGSTDTLRVVEVGFMMTTFTNWANAETFTMPNQKVVSSTIINITAESLAYRIIVLVNVPYNSDVMLAKDLALEAMTEHPRMVQDGSYEIPKVRFEDFSDSALTIRVSGYVDDFEDHRTIAGEIREAIYTKFRENDIAIAIPKMDIYVKDPEGGEKKY